MVCFPPDIKNQCPDCLYMEVTGRPKVKPSSPNPHEFVISLTINFNEHQAKLPGGHVKFGIRGGELRLALVNGTIPYTHRNLTGGFELAIQKERQSQASTSTRIEETSSVEISVEQKPSLKSNDVTANEKKGSYAQSDKFTVTSFQVTTKGSLNEPAWVFEVQTGEPVLKGLLSNVELATMLLTDNTWKIRATFKVMTLNDVILTETVGPLLRNASPERRTALELGIAKKMLQHLFSPYLSCVELGYE